MLRRTFVAGAVGTGLTSLLAACASPGSATSGGEQLPLVSLGPWPTATPGPQIIPPDPMMPTFAKPNGSIYSLPASVGNAIAWTVDDGFGPKVVIDYVDFAATSGARITFFVCGKAPSWSDVAPSLRPLVESGQVQIADHTFNHIRMVDAADDVIRSELMSNNDFIKRTYGVDARPYFRPPFGRYDDRVARAAASVGYTVPVLWNGTLSDAGEIDPALLLDFASRYMRPGTILLGHANKWPVVTVFRQLVGILEERGLSTVTLNDVFRS